MTDSEIYLKAAELVDSSHDYSCLAIERAAFGKVKSCIGQEHIPIVKAYGETFDLEPGFTYNSTFLFASTNGDEAQKIRVLMLLFMSEIAKETETSPKGRR